MLEVRKEVVIAAPVAVVWAALTDPAAIADWMGGPVLSDAHFGGSYAYFSGETTGVYTIVEPNSRLAYTWRQSDWPAEWPDSLVEWELTSHPTGISLSLLHSRFPNQDERDGHNEGWDLYWLDPMKEHLESNA
jgi:uncharacterized protein YndB with AHSA1/START domain